jgi:Tfp pilus assembly protein PilV
MFRNTQRTVGRMKVKSQELRVKGRTPGLGLRSSAGSRPSTLDPRLSHAGSRLLTLDSRRILRLGINLTEVLIAMGILTIGLLGVASVFPVGSHYMQKGETADRASAIAQAAFNDLLARGTLNPESWRTWEDAQNLRHTVATNVFRPTPLLNNSYTRRFAETYRVQKASQAVATNLSKADAERENSLEFGSVFVIDPIGVASIAHVNPDAPMPLRLGAAFPASRVWTAGVQSSAPNCWWTWKESAITNTGALGVAWPIRRVTFGQPINNPGGVSHRALDAPLAERLFSAPDDLVMDLPTAQDKPAIQPWRLANLDNGTSANDPLRRQSRGNYSWIVTVAPTTPEGRDALATDPSGHMYEVSVVVFYKRPVGSVTPVGSDGADLRIANTELLQQNERAAAARIISTGLNGGEILLTRFDTIPNSTIEPQESPFNNLKTGNWIMLCGPHPNSTAERPLLVSRWYRVLAIEGKNERLDQWGNPTTNATEPERRLVSLRGPQWPWQPSSTTNYEDISNALYVCIPTGAVAVHSKKIRLEGNSIYNGGATGLTSR